MEGMVIAKEDKAIYDAIFEQATIQMADNKTVMIGL